MSSEEVKAGVLTEASQCQWCCRAVSGCVTAQPRSSLLHAESSVLMYERTRLCTCKNHPWSDMHCYSLHPSHDCNSITEVREADWLQPVIFPVRVSVGHFLDLLWRGQSLWLLQTPQRERPRGGRLWMKLDCAHYTGNHSPNCPVHTKFKHFFVTLYLIAWDTCLHIRWALLPHD